MSQALSIIASTPEGPAAPWSLLARVSNLEEEQARLQRDRLRAERRREREKEYRLERAGKSVEDDNTEEELKKNVVLRTIVMFQRRLHWEHILEVGAQEG